jgi:hypothetical protein
MAKFSNPLDLYKNQLKTSSTPMQNPIPQQVSNPLSPYGATPIVGQNKSTLNSQRIGVQQGINNLFASKYGLGNYDPNVGWGQQKSNPIDGWDDLRETQALNEYNALLSKQTGLGNALSQYETIESNKLNQINKQGVIKEQSEKYLPTQLRAMGMGNVGASESSLIGIGNAYAGNVVGIEDRTNTQSLDVFKKYMDDSRLTDVELAQMNNKALVEYQDIAYQDAYSMAQESSSPDDLDQILSLVNGRISSSQYKNLEHLFNQMKNSAEWKEIWNPTDFTTPEQQQANQQRNMDAWLKSNQTMDPTGIGEVGIPPTQTNPLDSYNQGKTDDYSVNTIPQLPQNQLIKTYLSGVDKTNSKAALYKIKEDFHTNVISKSDYLMLRRELSKIQRK